jgi:hypothetical protein
VVVSDGMMAVEGVWLDVFFIDFLNRLRARWRRQKLNWRTVAARALFENVVSTEMRSLESIMKKMIWVINR